MVGWEEKELFIQSLAEVSPYLTMRMCGCLHVDKCTCAQVLTGARGIMSSWRSYRLGTELGSSATVVCALRFPEMSFSSGLVFNLQIMRVSYNFS